MVDDEHHDLETFSPTDDYQDEDGEADWPPRITAESIEPDQRFAKEVTEEIMSMSSMWQGRLPRPSNLERFNEIVPGLAREIADDMLEEGRRFDRAAAMDHEISSRVVAIMEKESAADIDFRRYVFDRFQPIFYLPFILIVIVLFAPIDDWVKAIAIPSILVGSVAPICISLLRGRMTRNESDVIKSVVPQIVDAVKSATATTSPSTDDTRKLTDPKNPAE